MEFSRAIVLGGKWKYIQYFNTKHLRSYRNPDFRYKVKLVRTNKNCNMNTILKFLAKCYF